MPEEWFDVAYINFDKAIMHGRVMFTNEEGFRQERYIEQVLTPSQKGALESLQSAHDLETQRLLKSFFNV